MILATAFNPFGTAETNASELLLNAVEEGADLVRVVLRTEYEAAGCEIVRLIRDLTPKAVICFGVAGTESVIRFEQVARNWNGVPSPDNAGEVRMGRQIVPGARELYLATLPYDAIAAELRQSGIAHMFSHDAGGYVCNHTFYCARHEIAQSGLAIPCGFIHVPPISEQRQFATLLEAMRICIRVAGRFGAL